MQPSLLTIAIRREAASERTTEDSASSPGATIPSFPGPPSSSSSGSSTPPGSLSRSQNRELTRLVREVGSVGLLMHGVQQTEALLASSVDSKSGFQSQIAPEDAADMAEHNRSEGEYNNPFSDAESSNYSITARSRKGWLPFGDAHEKGNPTVGLCTQHCSAYQKLRTRPALEMWREIEQVRYPPSARTGRERQASRQISRRAPASSGAGRVEDGDDERGDGDGDGETAALLGGGVRREQQGCCGWMNAVFRKRR